MRISIVFTLFFLVQAGAQTGPSIAASPALGPTEFRLVHVSRQFDFVVRMRARVPEGFDKADPYREGPGEVLVFRKGSSKPFQILALREIFASFNENGGPLANTAPMYGDQGMINVGDFNFDGYEDFAIQNGNEGSYGQPTFSVYLYSPSKKEFQFSRPLSTLIQQTLGFFTVDSQHKRLIAFSKSGCCYHETTEYTVSNNLPVPVSRVVEDGTRDPKYLYVSRQRFVNGRWQGKTEKVAQGMK